ncbi:hypothetical protein B9Z55_026203 [Caenorhabditis nigoni]|uniref:Uncharacterized protein n=1 Tax=Caenorhabditis nigoni TaxID=1611254 RepID=A0A2G5T2K6_9PELO|nr:hypothetical protein B9Z55_026203 [Caenorhabditis nigoni]
MDLCNLIHSANQSRCVVPKGRDHPLATLVSDVQRRRHQILNRVNPINLGAFDKHFEALHRARFAENVSENVPSTDSPTDSTGDVPEYPSSGVVDSFSFDPKLDTSDTLIGHSQPSTSAQVRSDSTRPRSLLEEILSGNNTSLPSIQVSMENQENQDTSVSDDGPSVGEILLGYKPRPSTNRKRSASQSHRAAPKLKVPAATFDTVCTNELQDSVSSGNSSVGVRRSELRLGTNAQQSSSRRIEEPARRGVVEDAGVHTPFEVEYDAPQVLETSSNPAHAHEPTFNTMDESIDIIARGEDAEDPERNWSRQKRQGMAGKRMRIAQTVNEVGIETGNVSGDVQRIVSTANSRIGETGIDRKISQLQTAFKRSREVLAEILAKKTLPTIAETVNMGAGQNWNQDSSWNPSISGVNCRPEPQVRSHAQPEVQVTSSNFVYTDDVREIVPAEEDGIDTRSGMYSTRSESRIDTTAQRHSSSRVEESFGGNAKVAEGAGVGVSFAINSSSYPIETEFDYERALRSLPYYSNVLAPTGFEYSQPSTSAQVSSPPPNAISTDNMTHQATLCIAPPPRMMESIMKKLSIEMKNREESGCLDFSQIEVDLRATGKELDDTIFFLNNLTAQLESAKQNGSNQ